MSDTERVLRLTVMASADRSLVTVVQPLQDAVKRARREVQSESGKIGEDLAKGVKKGAGEAKKSVDELGDAVKRVGNLIQDVNGKWRDASTGRYATAAAMAAAGVSNGMGSAGEEGGANFGKGFAKGINRTLSTIQAAGAAAVRVVGQVVSAMGADVSVSGVVGRNTKFQRQVVDVTNAGMGIQGKLATKENFAETTSAVDAAADHTRLARSVIAEGLSVFVDKASDIEAGKKMLAGVGDIALASGTDFVDLAGSAGEFFKMMPDGANKVEDMMTLLRVGAKQGQQMNLAFKDLAPTIGKLAAQASKMKGNFSDNLTDLMTLSQVSLKGGAAKGAEATRSGQAFAMDLTKGSSLKTFKKYGVKIFEDQNAQGGGTVLRQLEPMIIELLKKAKGDIKQLSDEFKGQKSQAVMTGFLNIYRAAGGGEKGLAAVQAEFTKGRQAMSQEEVENSAQNRKDTNEAKATSFMNKLDRIGEKMGERLYPALEKLEEPALKLAEALGSLATSAAEHPWGAIAAVIGGSIVKANLGTVVAAALKGSISGSGAAIAGPVGVAIAAVIAAAAIKAGIDNTVEGKAKGATANANQDMAALNAISLAKHARTPEERAAAAKALDEAMATVNSRREAAANVGFFEKANPWASVATRQAARDQANPNDLSMQAKELAMAKKDLGMQGPNGYAATGNAAVDAIMSGGKMDPNAGGQSLLTEMQRNTAATEKVAASIDKLAASSGPGMGVDNSARRRGP